MFEYKIIKHNDSILNIMGKDDWELIQIINEKSYWKRKIMAIRTKKEKNVFQEQDFYNKSHVKSCCSYAFDEDFVIAYKEWREERKLSPSYKTPYNEASEKRTFNKLAGKTKKIALKMLENASASKWLVLFDLDKKEEEEIILKLKSENLKSEIIQNGINSDDENKKIQKEKKMLNEYIENHPKIREEAKRFVDENYSGAEGVYRETLIMAKARQIAKLQINS